MFDLITWFINNLKAIFTHLVNYLIDLVNMLIDGLATFCLLVIKLLPAHTFSPPSLVVSQDFPALAWLNWLVPVDVFAAALGLIIVSYSTYYALAPLLRWVKAVR